MLFLSELESGRAVVSLGSIEALPVLEDVSRELAPSADRAGMRLEVDCPAGFTLPLRQRMLQVVAQNLATNAIRYAGSGSTLTLTCRETATRACSSPRTTASGSPRRTCRGSSSASTGPTRRAPRAAPGSGSRS